jgi:hypothetical protein
MTRYLAISYRSDVSLVFPVAQAHSPILAPLGDLLRRQHCIKSLEPYANLMKSEQETCIIHGPKEVTCVNSRDPCLENANFPEFNG